MKHGKRYRASAEKINSAKEYPVAEAARLVKEIANAKFNESIEVHMKLGVDPRHSDQVVRGNVTLPNGTGKDVRVLVFAKGELEKAAKGAGADFVGAEELVEKIQGGWLDFDQVVATPDMMPVIGKVAKILGPRGLMPSPKSGTVTMNVAGIIKELKAGKISYRVDKGGNVHAPVGKSKFTAEQLAENINALMESVMKAKPSAAKGTYIRGLYLTSTMSPSLRLDRSFANA